MTPRLDDLPPAEVRAARGGRQRGRLRGRFVALLRDQRTAFVLVGGTNVAIFTVFFLALFAVLGDQLGYLLIVVIAYALAIGCAFALHRRFVFKVAGPWLPDLLRFVLVQLCSLGLNLLTLPLLVEVAAIPVVPAQLLSMVLVLVFNYFGHLLFSFRRSPTR